MKIDWKRKLSSRKLWAAIIAVVISLCAIFGIDDMTTQQLVGLITAVSSLVAYILGETIVDAAGASARTNETPAEITEIINESEVN